MTKPPAAATPPVAERRPHAVTHHGVTIEDPWFWLRDPGYPVVTDASVLAYLAAENDWFAAWATPRAARIAGLTAELRGRMVEDDASVPARDGAFDYWWCFEPGGQYRLWLRRPVAGGDEQLVLSEPALAKGHDYFRLGGFSVSPDGRLLAYATDCDGSERYTLRVRDIASGADTATIATNSIGAPVWAADSAALAWTEVDERWRPWRIRLHRLGAGGDDAVLFAEADIGFRVHVGRSQDRSQWLIVVADHVTSEVHLVPAAAPLTAPRLVSARQTGREYDVDVRGQTLFIRTNDTHPNFRIARAALDAPGDWHDVIAASDRHYSRGLSAFASYLAISERIDGLDQIRLHFDDGRDRYVAFPEA
ncbi:MAG: S9 family peptidase, partial [Polymorphobacter sp.]